MKRALCQLALAATTLACVSVALADPSGLPSGRYLAVSCTDKAAVRILSPSTLAELDTIHTRFRARNMTSVDGTGRVLVFPEFSTRDGYVEALVGTGQVLDRTRIHWPFEGRLTSDHSKLYVTTLDGGELLAVNPTNGEVIRSLDATTSPARMDLDEIAGQLFVSDNSGFVSVYDVMSDTLLHRFSAGSVQEMVVASAKVYWTTGGNGVKVSDATTFSDVATISMSSIPIRLRPSIDRTRVTGLAWSFDITDTTYFEIDTTTDSIVTTRSFPGRGYDFAVDEGTHRVFVTLPDEHRVLVLDATTGSFSTAPFQNEPLQMEWVSVP